MGLKKMARRRFEKRLSAAPRNVFTTTGFTLIEVVIAIAILGVALAVIFELFSGGLRLGRVSKEYVMAMNYASLKMEELTTKEEVLEGSEEGEFNKEYRWQTFVKKLDLLPIEEKGIDFKPPAELMNIKVNVLWKSGAKERLTAIESYKAVKLEENEGKR
jgi:prepilin-type N-terminal cleavage/methylation domain-containing protein